MCWQLPPQAQMNTLRPSLFDQGQSARRKQEMLKNTVIWWRPSSDVNLPCFIFSSQQVGWSSSTAKLVSGYKHDSGHIFATHATPGPTVYTAQGIQFKDEVWGPTVTKKLRKIWIPRSVILRPTRGSKQWLSVLSVVTGRSKDLVFGRLAWSENWQAVDG